MFDKDAWHAILEHTQPEELETVMQVCKTSRSLAKLFVAKYKRRMQIVKQLFMDIDTKLRMEYGDACSAMDGGAFRSVSGRIDEAHFNITHWNFSYCICVESLAYKPGCLVRERKDTIYIYHNQVCKNSVYRALPTDVHALVRDAIFGRFPWAE